VILIGLSTVIPLALGRKEAVGLLVPPSVKPKFGLVVKAPSD
jgi:hypothetical protein